jgi:hypothetical protein
MVGEVDGGRGRGATRREGNDVSPSGADWITEIAPQSTPTRGIGHELILQNSETGGVDVELKDLSNYWINESVNIAGADSIAVAIDSDEASPRAITVALEDHGGGARIQNRIGAASEEQPLELARCRSQSRRAPDLSEPREGGGNDNCQHREHENNLDQ